MTWDPVLLSCLSLIYLRSSMRLSVSRGIRHTRLLLWTVSSGVWEAEREGCFQKQVHRGVLTDIWGWLNILSKDEAAFQAAPILPQIFQRNKSIHWAYISGMLLMLIKWIQKLHRHACTHTKILPGKCSGWWMSVWVATGGRQKAFVGRLWAINDRYTR